MVKNVIEYINQRITFIDKKHGLCEIVRESGNSFPAEYTSVDQYDQVQFDYSDSLIYHRLRSSITESESEESDVSCEMLITKTYPMRLIARVKKSSMQDNSYSDSKIAHRIEKAIRFSNSPTLNESLNTDTVSVIIQDTNLNRYEVWSEEFSVDMQERFDHVLLAIDYDIEITANESCFLDYSCDETDTFNPCGDCSATVIDGESTVRVTAGESYTCQNSGDCDDVTVLDQDGATVTTVAAGGTYNVIVFDGIVDSGTPYSNSIIDNS